MKRQYSKLYVFQWPNPYLVLPNSYAGAICDLHKSMMWPKKKVLV